MERLQKYLARCGVASRRKAEEIISSGRVKVNGEVITEMGYKVSGNDTVEVDGEVLEIKDKIYLAMNKPRGIISSSNDEKGRKTVVSILPKEIQDYRVFPVGRLDYDTKGILLLTNDGEFMNTLVGPKSNLEKEYLVRVDGIASRDVTKKIAYGVDIGGYTTRRAFCEIVEVDNEHKSTLIRVIIREGKYHQIKRMFEAVGYPVKHLTRVRFGEITTEGLKEGEVRYLTPHEIKRLVAMSKESSKDVIIHKVDR